MEFKEGMNIEIKFHSGWEKHKIISPSKAETDPKFEGQLVAKWLNGNGYFPVEALHNKEVRLLEING